MEGSQASGSLLAGFLCSALDEQESSQNNKMALGSQGGAFHARSPCSLQPAPVWGVGERFLC